MATPITTIVPFSALPTCAYNCGHLYDANGACVPPAVPTAVGAAQYTSCFCADARVAPFSTGTAGVCDNACTAAADSGGLASIQAWFTSFCSVDGKAVQTTSTATTSSAGAHKTGTSGSGHNTWLSGHWRWVVFIVVVVVGIAAVWIGACLWHRRYLRKKDRQYALGHIRASTGAASGTAGLNAAAGGLSQPDIRSSGAPSSFQAPPHNPNLAKTGSHTPSPPSASVGVFPPGPQSAFDTETEKRRTLLGRRRN